jgi:hypothetical protein
VAEERGSSKPSGYRVASSAILGAGSREIMEVVKSYRIPVEAPRDLIDEYFMKCRVLDVER